VPVDFRLIAASNRNLEDAVKRSLFREDLYYRLNVIAIDLPPLRDRGDDLLLLINHYSAQYAAEADRKVPRFTDEALRLLRTYHWPGNVRELENVIQRLVFMTDGDIIDAPDLPSLMRCTDLGRSGFSRTLAEVEVEYICNVLASVGGNKTLAASMLGIDRKTLREKLKS
jgi:DNA-binding NtrC family response regulator